MSTPGALVTLVGPAGVGKTRLAAEVARAVDGARFVDLTGAADGDAVDAVVLAALLPDAKASVDPMGELVAALVGHGPPLLVFDAAELVAAAVGALCRRLAAAGVRAATLVTSRVPLGVAGEVVEPIGPLDRPRPGAPLSASTAVQVLMDGVPSTAPPLVPSPTDEEDLARIVAACEGMPLSLVLAGARLGVLTLGELSRQLEARGTQALSDPDGTSVQRSVARSVEALSPELADALTACAAFRGSFDLPGAAAVLGRPLPEATERVQALVQRSLARVRDGAAGGRRFQLWDSVRDCVADRVTDDVRERWRAHLVEVAARFSARAVGDGLAGALAEVGDDLPDLLAVAAAEHPAAARVAVAAYRLLLRRLSRPRLVELFVAAARVAPEPALELRLWVVASGDLLQLDRTAEARSAAARAWALAGVAGTRDQRLAAAWTYGLTCWFLGDRAPGREVMTAASEEPGGDPLVRARLASNLAEMAHEEGDPSGAARWLARTAAATDEVVEPLARAWLQLREAGLRVRAGHLERAAELLDACLTGFGTPVAMENDRAVAHLYAAMHAWRAGDADRARAAWAAWGRLRETAGVAQAQSRLWRALTVAATEPAVARDALRQALPVLSGAHLPGVRAVQLRLAVGLARALGEPVPDAALPLPDLRETYPYLAGLEDRAADPDPDPGAALAAALRARPELEAHLAAEVLDVARASARRRGRVWVVGPAGSWFRRPEAEVRSLHTRPVLAALLDRLAGGAVCVPEELFAVGWPGERVRGPAARNRVRVAIHTLRRLGFDRIAFQDGGYVVFGDEPLVRSDG